MTKKQCIGTRAVQCWVASLACPDHIRDMFRGSRLKPTSARGRREVRGGAGVCSALRHVQGSDCLIKSLSVLRNEPEKNSTTDGDEF